MNSGPAGAVASALPPDNLSLAARMAGIIRRPRMTFQVVVAAPRPAPLLVLLFVVPFGLSAAFLSTDVGRQALIDQWERTAIAFGQPVDAARFAEYRTLSERRVAYAAAMALAGGPVAATAVAAVVYGVFTARGRRTRFRQVLGVVAHAGVILLLRDLVATPIHYARESIGGATSLVRFVTAFDEGSPVARFLALVDVFVLWWLIVLAIGIAVLYDQRVRPIAATLGTVYVAGALALAGAMVLLGGT